MSPVLRSTALSLAGRLHPTDLELAPGELCCLVGPNGSGKTSLLHALAGIDRASGSVLIENVDPRLAGPAARQYLLAYLPASRDIAWPILASDLIRLGNEINHARIEPLIASLELGALLDRRSDRLSTGERSRVLIARALAAQPRLLLLDEPVANLDPLWQLKLLDLIANSARGSGQAVLLAIHDLDLAGRYADRLLVMAEGRIVANGKPRDILNGPTIPQIFGISRSQDGWAIA